MKWILVIFFLLVAAMVLYLSLGGRGEGALNVVGSTSVQPFAEMLAQEYEKSHPGEYIDVQGGGSTAGLQATINGLADIGMCSRSLKKDEAPLYESFTVARDGLAIVVHLDNPVAALTRAQIRRLFTGEIRNWKDVGGRDAPVRLITREEGSGTREAFVNLAMQKARMSRAALTQESNGAVKELVRNDRCAIGYMSLGLVGGELKILTVDGVTPSSETVKNGQYPLARPFLFVTQGKPSDRARKFIDFVLSPEGQAFLVKEGLISAK